MIRVGLVTSWGDKCGISEYARHLIDHTPKANEVIVTPLTVPFEQLTQSMIQKHDIFQMNECGYTMQGFTGAMIVKLKQSGKKTLLTMHASNPKNNHNVLSDQFDRVVIHERGTEDGFTYIPQGCPVFATSRLHPPAYDVGTCGFPFPFKNHRKVAEACRRLGMKFLALAPESHHVDARQVERDLLAIAPNTEVNRNWLTDQQMLYHLAACRMTIFPYTNHTPGPSAAALMGVSAGVPVIMSRCAQFEHFFDREQQFYFIESADPTADQIMEVIARVSSDISLGRAKVPTKTYEESRWDVIGMKYRKVYAEMMA